MIVVRYAINRRHVKERTDSELRGHTVVGEIGAHKNVVLGDPRHLGMTHLVRFAARHDQPKRLERLPTQQFAKTRCRHESLHS